MTNSTRSELMAKAEEAIRFYVELGNEVLNLNMSYPTPDYSLRGKCGGQYDPRIHSIRINMVLLSENLEDYLDQTIPHEVAHALTRSKYERYGRRIQPHGNEWKSVMRALGKRPDRCHSYDVSNSTVRTVKRQYKYACRCKTFELTIIRHRRAQKAVAQDKSAYKCRACNSPLKYII
jgi:SprT protein